MDEVFRLADRITVLRDGRWSKRSTATRPTPREMTHLMVGREIEETDLSSRALPAKWCSRSSDCRSPGPATPGGWRLQDINFSLRRGEILGIAGLMGAGRTELLECLFGAAASRPGRILLDGRPVRFRIRPRPSAAGIALVTEDRKRLGLFAQWTSAKTSRSARSSKAARPAC